jgi:hypothetical protein
MAVHLLLRLGKGDDRVLFGSIMMPTLARQWVLEARRRLLLPQLLVIGAGLVNVEIRERGAAATTCWTLD